MKRLLEVCCADIDSVRSAVEGGADRIELCSALEIGGVTPSYGLIKQAVDMSSIPVNVLIRPRGGDFLYSDAEINVMIDDIVQCKRLGANGVVIGCLQADGTIDLDACRRLIDAAQGLSVTFHRAFDVCCNPTEALEQIVALGCDRILTSGQAPSALQGCNQLRALNDQARGRITLLAGAGVGIGNAAEIIRLSGVTELHASAKHTIHSLMTYRNTHVAMGTDDSDEYSRWTTSTEIVNQLANIIHNHQ